MRALATRSKDRVTERAPDRTESESLERAAIVAAKT
ncbi:MAG: hypothetical protein QOH65_1293, partial [Methylobacteriaceae bacterium]|nr:hypothetical protein [Methylobacteriaceae bacterium]